MLPYIQLLILLCSLCVRGIFIDEALQDIFPPSSSLCSESGTTRSGTTSFDFVFVPTHTWAEVNAKFEKNTFLAEMNHIDSNPNRTWHARIGKGGNIYSFVSQFGEAIPPQTNENSAWVDEVWQMVSVDHEYKKDIQWINGSYYIHQAGTYKKGDPLLKQTPFYSPNLSHHCGGRQCSFVSWGQQAKPPTMHSSGVIYYVRYKDCQDGVLEATYLIHNSATESGDIPDYFNVPWGGVRTSVLKHAYNSLPDGKPKRLKPMPRFGDVPNALWQLCELGGYSMFAEDLSKKRIDDNLALSFVFGTKLGPTKSTRLRLGVAGRDYTVFTINRILDLPPGTSLYDRQYIITGKLSGMEKRAAYWSEQHDIGLLTHNQTTKRKVQLVSHNTGVFGVNVGGHCAVGPIRIICNGSTVPQKGLRPLFFIRCGSKTYLGSDLYHFDTSMSDTGMHRPYVCDSDQTIRPSWQLLGYFPEGSCAEVEGSVYDPLYCTDPPAWTAAEKALIVISVFLVVLPLIVVAWLKRTPKKLKEQNLLIRNDGLIEQ